MKNFQRTTKINQGSHSKKEIQVREKRARKITHLKIMEQQGTHHLKFNPKFWSFASKNSRFQDRDTP